MASILQVQAQENRTIGSKSTRAIGSFVNSHFGDSRVEGLKTLHQDSRNREVRSPDRVRSFVVGPTLITSRNSAFRHFRG